MKKAVFIFRRDLRVEDNTALIAALSENDYVIPCFIFDPRQIKDNKYKSDNCVQFMIESLLDLEKQLKSAKGKLYYFYGKHEDVVKKLVASEKISCVYVNKDYTPYSKKRDNAIAKIVELKQYDDCLLQSTEKTLKKDGEAYTIFTPYYKNASKIKVAKPVKNKYTNYWTSGIKNEKKIIAIKKNPDIYVHGGRTECKKLLSELDKMKYYEQIHDYPSKETTKLSAHNKFGTCSIREIYFAICDKIGWHSPVIRQLHWRDFFTQLAYHYPKVFGQEYRYKPKWEYDSGKFKKWCEGKTGFPIVDAGMRQLNTTGYMHNRVRMIVAQFLTKDLHIDWRWGEKYFATKLVDYDPCVNNGNWQWNASTGADAQPYFRIFNPWTQQMKFDKNCVYIKKWVSEISGYSAYEIHNHQIEHLKGYYAPMVEHSAEAKKAVKMFR